MNVLVFKSNEKLCVLLAVGDFDIKEAGERSIQAGIPFWLIDDVLLPDVEYRDAWTFDEAEMGEPYGYGTIGGA